MRKVRENNQLIYLFISNLIILFIGMGLFPILPHYASRFGADQGTIGIFFAVIYTCLTTGNMVSGWLSTYLGRKKLFIAAGFMGIPALFLLGYATQLWQVLLLTASVWFCGGIDLALINIFTGQHSTNQNRGRSFSMISLTIPLGSLLGASTIAYLASKNGYASMFAALATVWTLLPILGLLAIVDRANNGRPASTSRAEANTKGPGKQDLLLLAAAVISATVISIERLGLSLTLKNLDYSPETIASTATISGFIALPILLLVGSFSDRLGKKQALWLVYFMAAGGAFVLSQANHLWLYWLAATLTMGAFCLNGAMTSALAVDLASQRPLEGKLSWINTATSSGAIVSFLSTGYLLELVGPKNLFLLATVLPVFAAAMIQIITSRIIVSKTFSTLPESDCY